MNAEALPQWPDFLENYPPERYTSKRAIASIYRNVFIRDMLHLTLEQIKEYIKKYLDAGTINLSFIADIFLHNNYVKYHLRNRSVISAALFTTAVEGLFAKFFVGNDIEYARYAMEIGIGPIFVFNMVKPYFYRILNNTMHGRTGQNVFDNVPTTKYRLSFTALNVRYTKLLGCEEFMRALAFANSDMIRAAMDEIFSSFLHFGFEVIDFAEMRKRLGDEFLIGRLEYRDEANARIAPIKRELAEYVYNPDRIWRLSQRAGILPWEFMEMLP